MPGDLMAGFTGSLAGRCDAERALKKLAVAEGGTVTDERDQVRGVHGAPASLG